MNRLMINFWLGTVLYAGTICNASMCSAEEAPFGKPDRFWNYISRLDEERQDQKRIRMDRHIREEELEHQGDADKRRKADHDDANGVETTFGDHSSDAGPKIAGLDFNNRVVLHGTLIEGIVGGTNSSAPKTDLMPMAEKESSFKMADENSQRQDQDHSMQHAHEVWKKMQELPAPHNFVEDWVPSDPDPTANGSFGTIPDNGSPVPYRLNGHLDIQRKLPWQIDD